MINQFVFGLLVTFVKRRNEGPDQHFISVFKERGSVLGLRRIFVHITIRSGYEKTDLVWSGLERAKGVKVVAITVRLEESKSDGR